MWCHGFGLIKVLPLPPVFFFLFVSAYRMARGEEETSTSQAGRNRGPIRGTPSTSSIISSLSVEELRVYCEIPDNIEVMLSDGPAHNIVGGLDNTIFFTRKQLAAGLCL